MYMDTRVHKQAGFSLIEVLVSLSIFAIIVTMGVGSMLVLIDANAKAQNTQQVINNVSFMLDSMSRDLRTGFGYYCHNNVASLNGEFAANDSFSVRDCVNGGSGIVFTETGGSLTGVGAGSSRIGYRLSQIDGVGVIERRIGQNGSWEPVTSSEVDITNLRFVVTGTDRAPANRVSPKVTIMIEGVMGAGTELEARFALQTSITQQTLDL